MNKAFLAAAIGMSLSGAVWAEGAGSTHVFTQAEQLEWQPAKSIGQGAQMAVIEGDPAKAEPFTMRLKLEDGTKLSPHTHPEEERVTVLSGTLHLAAGDDFNRKNTRKLETGDVAIMPEGMKMYGYTEGRTIVQLHGMGPWGIDYLNPQDDPRQ